MSNFNREVFNKIRETIPQYLEVETEAGVDKETTIRIPFDVGQQIQTAVFLCGCTDVRFEAAFENPDKPRECTGYLLKFVYKPKKVQDWGQAKNTHLGQVVEAYILGDDGQPANRNIGKGVTVSIVNTVKARYNFKLLAITSNPALLNET